MGDFFAAGKGGVGKSKGLGGAKIKPLIFLLVLGQWFWQALAMVHELPYLPESFVLESDLLDQLSSRTGCQRCLVGVHGEMLLVLHDVPKPGEPERKALFFWHDAQKVWHGCDGKGLQGLAHLLDDYAKAIDEQEAIVDDADTAKEIFDLLRKAAPLARSSRNLYHALLDASEKLPKDRDLRLARDRAHENERASDLLYGDARVTLEFIRAERAEEQAKSSDRLARLGFRLNLMAGFFLPLVALGGLMGMNVKLPEFMLDGFWFIFTGGLVVGVLILIAVGYRTGESSDE